LKLDLRHLSGQAHSADQPGRNSDARLFLRELSNQISDLAARTELRSLANEQDPELLGAALRSFAIRQESRGRSDLAIGIYQLMAGAPEAYGEGEARLANDRLEALRGRGSIGARFEIFAQNFVREVSDPASLTGMALAGGVFQGMRLASYARLLASPSANFFTRGFGARALSCGLGFLAEAPAFSLGIRSTNAMLGRSQNWEATTLSHELAASYLTLGALRLSGAGGSALYGRLNPAGRGLLSRGLVQQVSMLSGITTANWLEQQAGLRERTSGANLLANSLASLLHFNVAGRLLHGLPGGEFSQRLQAQQARLERLPPSGFRTESGIGSRRSPVLVGADSVFMSSIDGTPSERPPPLSSGGNDSRGAARPSQPPPARDLKAELTSIESSLAPLYDGRTSSTSWMAETLGMVRLYRQILDLVGLSEGRTPQPREEILHHLRDLAAEADLIGSLLTESRSVERHEALSADQHLVGRFIEHLYRSVNNFINVLDHTGTIPEPLQHLRTARFWLQHGLEKATVGESGSTDLPPGFPYSRGKEGYYVIPSPNRHVIIVGDERGPRTFDLMNDGHRVTHVEFDNSKLRITQRLMEMKVQRAKDSGQWRLNLPSGAEFHARIQDADPADYVEAYFPILFDALKPRSDARRFEQLRDLIVTNLAIRLKPEGSVFVISSRHDAIEDLAREVHRFPDFELMELEQIRDRMPLRAGMHVTDVPGESLYSWLVFRKRGGE